MELKDSQKKKTDIARRPELDVIIVALTWGMLLNHICMHYSPISVGPQFMGLQSFLEPDSEPTKEDAYTIMPAQTMVQVFLNFLQAWVLPMFFYLSGKGNFLPDIKLNPLIV